MEAQEIVYPQDLRDQEERVDRQDVMEFDESDYYMI